MNDSDIAELSRAVFAEILELELDDVGDDDDFYQDLDGDSLQKLEMIVTLEKRLGIRFAEEEARALNNVAQVVETVRARQDG